MALYAGIDGGGSKTQLFIIDTIHETVVSSSSKASNPFTVGWENAVSVVVELLEDGLKKIGHSRADLHGLCAAMAGMDRPQQAQRMRDSLKQRFPTTEIEVVNDALAALSAGTGGDSGVVLIAGTGSIAVGETNIGSIYRAGGYGYLLGDEGSGFDIGRTGLMAAVASYEQRGPATALWNEAVNFFGVGHPLELITKVYETAHPVGRIAAFAKSVLTLSHQDEVAHEILQQALKHYQKLVDSVFAQAKANNHQTVRNHPTEPLDQTDVMSNLVVLAGGLLTGNSDLASQLQQRMPNRRCVVLRHSPASGAGLRAIQQYLEVNGAASEEFTKATRLWESLLTQHEAK